MLEVGKIVIAGLTAAGAIVLGEVIEKGLISIPGAEIVFAFEIPLVGSLASIIGIFLGAVVAGIIGAIAINQIDKILAKKQRNEMTSAIINKSNEVLQTQSVMKAVKQAKVEETKKQVADSIIRRHEEVSALFEEAERSLSEDEIYTEDVGSDNEDIFSEIADSQEECEKIQDSIKNIQNSTDKKLDNIDDLLDSLL